MGQDFHDRLLVRLRETIHQCRYCHNRCGIGRCDRGFDIADHIHHYCCGNDGDCCGSSPADNLVDNHPDGSGYTDWHIAVHGADHDVDGSCVLVEGEAQSRKDRVEIEMVGGFVVVGKFGFGTDMNRIDGHVGQFDWGVDGGVDGVGKIVIDRSG